MYSPQRGQKENKPRSRLVGLSHSAFHCQLTPFSWTTVGGAAGCTLDLRTQGTRRIVRRKARRRRILLVVGIAEGNLGGDGQIPQENMNTTPGRPVICTKKFVGGPKPSLEFARSAICNSRKVIRMSICSSTVLRADKGPRMRRPCAGRGRALGGCKANVPVAKKETYESSCRGSVKANRSCIKCKVVCQTEDVRLNHERICRGSELANRTCLKYSRDFPHFGARIVHEKSCGLRTQNLVSFQASRHRPPQS